MFKLEVELCDYGYTHYVVVRNGTADASQYSFNSFLSITFNIFPGTAPILPGAGAVIKVSTETSTSTSTSNSTSAITNIYTSASTSANVQTGQAIADSKTGGNANVSTIALGAVLGLVGLVALLGLFFGWETEKAAEKTSLHFWLSF
jgi:hypothetical protein